MKNRRQLCSINFVFPTFCCCSFSSWSLRWQPFISSHSNHHKENLFMQITWSLKSHGTTLDKDMHLKSAFMSQIEIQNKLPTHIKIGLPCEFRFTLSSFHVIMSHHFLTKSWGGAKRVFFCHQRFDGQSFVPIVEHSDSNIYCDKDDTIMFYVHSFPRDHHHRSMGWASVVS